MCFAYTTYTLRIKEVQLNENVIKCSNFVPDWNFPEIFGSHYNSIVVSSLQMYLLLWADEGRGRLWYIFTSGWVLGTFKRPKEFLVFWRSLWYSVGYCSLYNVKLVNICMYPCQLFVSGMGRMRYRCFSLFGGYLQNLTIKFDPTWPSRKLTILI